MKRPLFTIVSVLSLLPFLSMLLVCGRSVARDETLVLPPRETPPSGPAIMRDGSVPVVYAPHADPEPLTPDRLAVVLQVAEELRPAEREVWFVLVLFNRGKHWNAKVYYTPDEVNGRMRKGRYIHYGWSAERMRGRKSPFAPGGDEPPRKREAQAKYLQVIDHTANGREFDYIGHLREMPFNPNDGVLSDDPLPLSDEELIAVIDLTSRPTPQWLREETPVYRIELEGDHLRVYFGWMVGMLYGGGWYRDVRRSGNGWIVNSAEGMWVS